MELALEGKFGTLAVMKDGKIGQCFFRRCSRK